MRTKEGFTTVEIFNLIAIYAETKGYDTRLFTEEFPKMNDLFEFEQKGVDYIHLLKNGELKISIYFDRHSILAWDMPPYYELWDRVDIERFELSEDEEIKMYDKVKKLI